MDSCRDFIEKAALLIGGAALIQTIGFSKEFAGRVETGSTPKKDLLMRQMV
ncbi:hypothetical protein ACVWYN_002127 [Pedobacter sp. UYP24]